MSITSKTCHHQAIFRTAVLRGGRMTKFKGQAASYAPAMGLALAVLAVGAMPERARAANECGPDGAGATTISCAAGTYSGVTYNTPEAFTLDLNDPAIIVRDLGVSVISSAGNTGNIVVNGTGFKAITTTASNGIGLFARNNGTGGDATATLTKGDISTTGFEAHGVRTWITNSANSGNSSATMHGGTYTATAAATGAIGVYASTVGSGNATATLNGGVVTTAGTGGGGMRSITSNASGTGISSAVMNGGSIVTKGEFSLGFDAYSFSKGAATAVLNAGTISTLGTNSTGIRSLITHASNTAASSATVNGGSVTTNGKGASGVESGHYSFGDATATLAAGSVATLGDEASGLYAWTSNSSIASTATVNVSGGSITTSGFYAHGAVASNQGLGDAVVSLTGGTISASGADSHGAAAASAGGDTRVTVNGRVTGGSGTGYAIHTETKLGKLSTIAVGANAVISAASGNAIANNAGNSAVTIAAGAKVAGAIRLGDGSDSLAINGAADLSAITLLDGGDDLAAADGMIDTLDLNGWSGQIAGARTLNWEVLNINGGTVGVSDRAITAGTINVIGGGTLDGSNSLVATANVVVSSGAKLVAGNAAGTNAMKVTGNLTNNGTVDLRGPAGQAAAGDRLTVTGNYAGGAGSRVILDVKLGDDSSPTDRLVVNGNASGNSGIVVNNVGGGALTSGDGIKVVQVDGTSAPGSFALAGGTVDAGAFRYSLYNGGLTNPNDQDWYLRSRTRDIVTPTVALARVTQDLGLSTLGTLHERVGEQEHLGLQPSAQDAAPGGMWGRLIGKSYSDTAKSAQFGDARANGQFGGMQLGLDVYRGVSDSGSRTHVGVYGAHLWSGTHEYQVTPRALYAGTTSSQGWVAGLYATHYAATGWYVDAVVQGSWLGHKANATDGTTLRTDSSSWLASLELGKPIDLGSSFKLEPQVQLIYGSTGIDDTRDSTGVLNTYDIEDSLTGRFGFRLKRTWDYNQASEGGLFTAYLKANVWGTLAGGDTGLTVGNSAKGIVRHREVWGDVGFGASFSLSPNAEFFADADVEFGIDQGATALSGHTGLRVRF